VNAFLIDMPWLDLCMAHWPADPNILQSLLPAGVDLDRYEGVAWLSVVPFRMKDVRMRGLPSLPGFAAPIELNLRTYVRLRGRRAVWFFSLDCDSPALIRAARFLTGLPYCEARMSIETTEAGWFNYESARVERKAPPARFRARYGPVGEPRIAEPGSLEEFLHERYYLAARHAGTVGLCRVRHDPWLMQSAEIEIEENTLGDAIEHPLSGLPERAYFCSKQYAYATPYWPVALP
jgi:uncharacterized protein YqjF (DUF2071 family)